MLLLRVRRLRRVEDVRAARGAGVHAAAATGVELDVAAVERIVAGRCAAGAAAVAAHRRHRAHAR